MDENTIPLISIVFGFLGTLLGGAITIASNWLSYYWQSRKDADQWEREKELEEKRAQKELEQIRVKHRVEIIRNCLYYLPLHVSDVGLRGQLHSLKYLDDSVRWVSELLIYIELPVDIVNKANGFLDDPRSDVPCRSLLNSLKTLAGEFGKSV